MSSREHALPAPSLRLTALLCVLTVLPLAVGIAGAMPAGARATSRTADAVQPIAIADISALKLAMERQ
jgi:hypothetical protein